MLYEGRFCAMPAGYGLQDMITPSARDLQGSPQTLYNLHRRTETAGLYQSPGAEQKGKEVGHALEYCTTIRAVVMVEQVYCLVLPIQRTRLCLLGDAQGSVRRG